MFLDKYTPANHDLYLYESDTNDSSTWGQFDLNEDGLGTVAINRPTGYNTSCLLPAFGSSSPPWHKISVTDRRLNFLGSDHIENDSVKDRYIKNSFASWRTGSNDTELHLANLWNSGSVHFIPISDQLALCSRSALEDAMTRRDVALKRFNDGSFSPPLGTNPTPNYYMSIGGDQVIGQRFNAFLGSPAGEPSEGAPQNEVLFFDASGNPIRRYLSFIIGFNEGGDSPLLKDPMHTTAWDTLFDYGINSNPGPATTILSNGDYVSNNQSWTDPAIIPRDLMIVEISGSGQSGFDDSLKPDYFVTEQQLIDNSYYDGTNFYSPVLYGLDDNGRVFKVRKRYWASSSGDKPTVREVADSPAQYVEVDDEFGKPLGMWRGSASAPMFAKGIVNDVEVWALYSMGPAFTGMTEDLWMLMDEKDTTLHGADSRYAGFITQLLPDDALTDVRDFLTLNTSSITIPRGIGHKLGVRYNGTDNATGEELGPIDLVSTDLVQNAADPESLDDYEKVPPTLIDESLEIKFTKDIEKSGFNSDYSYKLPPYSPRKFASQTDIHTTLEGDLVAGTPHMISLDVNQASSNINNPSNKPYTAEIEWFLVEDGYDVEYTPTEFMLAKFCAGRAQIRTQDRSFFPPYALPGDPGYAGGQTSTSLLTPGAAVCLQDSLDPTTEEHGKTRNIKVYVPQNRVGAKYRGRGPSQLSSVNNPDGDPLIDPNLKRGTYEEPLVTIFADDDRGYVFDNLVELGNFYIQPGPQVAINFGPLAEGNETEFVSATKRNIAHKMSDSFFLDELSNFRDMPLSSRTKVNTPGCRLRCVFSLINEYGRSTYEVTTKEFYDFIFYQDVRDELFYPSTGVNASVVQNVTDPFHPSFLVLKAPDDGVVKESDMIIRKGEQTELKVVTRGASWAGFPARYYKPTLIFGDGSRFELDWVRESASPNADKDANEATIRFTLPSDSPIPNGTQLVNMELVIDEVPGNVGSNRRFTWGTSGIDETVPGDVGDPYPRPQSYDVASGVAGFFVENLP